MLVREDIVKYSLKLCLGPNPGVKIARRHVRSILCDGSRYDAGGPMASANSFPSGREIQYSTLGKNKMCRLVGQSNTRAGGLKVGQNKPKQYIDLFFFQNCTHNN